METRDFLLCLFGMFILVVNAFFVDSWVYAFAPLVSFVVFFVVYRFLCWLDKGGDGKVRVIDVNRRLSWVVFFVVLFFVLNLLFSGFLFYYGVHDGGFGVSFDEEENAYLGFQNMTNVNLSLRTAGVYLHRYNTAIVFLKHKEVDDVIGTFIHESGHYVADEFLSFEQVVSWSNLYYGSGEGDFVSGYANSSWGEDFAESFQAGWVCDFDAGRIGVPEKAEWMRENLGYVPPVVFGY